MEPFVPSVKGRNRETCSRNDWSEGGVSDGGGYSAVQDQ